jgi:uncharacterized protein
MLLRLINLTLPFHHSDADVRSAACAALQIADTELLELQVFRRGYDARRKSAIVWLYTLHVRVADPAAVLARKLADVSEAPDVSYHFPALSPAIKQAPRPVVIGFGPCGLFAALILGLRPIVVERGQAVRERTQSTWGLWRKSVLNPESNVQFGEGGAGTFSDGKLWSQVSDPKHYGRKVLDEFFKAGAPDEILYVSKPHIGTFRLVSMIEKMRADIEALGGEIRFNTKVVAIAHKNQALASITLDNGEVIACERAVCAIGHSARDTFEMLYRAGVDMQAKPFSIGFRIEHPQSLIDEARFGRFAGDERLGAADYKLVHHAKNGRSVYSFCMCPGGTVVAATSEPNRVVTNGMSQYSRNERNANAGFVVGIEPKDFLIDRNDPYYNTPLAGVSFQRLFESQAFELGGSNYFAPGQRVADFLGGRASKSFGSVQPSYKPGVLPTDLAGALPDYAIVAMREALPALDRKIKGFAMDDAVLTGVETRTSAPIRVARDATLQSPSVRGLFPAGEGCGYAGGILSAAIDGIEVAQAVVASYR